MNEYTFHNVTITLEAPSAEEAYTKLCECFERVPGLEYETDRYSGPGIVEKWTQALWPERFEEET